MEELSLQSPPRLLKVLVVYFLLTQCYRASDTASSPVISLLGIDRNRGAVILNCDSNSWYPEPEVVWLDGEGNLLSAGPTETVRGPDDLYTVSSRVTVEKRHSNNFTCRVHQKDINQTRETHIYVPDDFFAVLCSSSTTVGLAVSLAVCILFIIVSFLLKLRRNAIKKKISRRDETDYGKNCSKSNNTEDQFVTEEEREREQLMTHETVQMEVLNKGKEKKKHLKKQKCEQEEQQRREEAQNRVKEKLETKKNEVKLKQAELQQLREERQRIQTNLQTLKKDLENKNKELKTIQATLSQSSWWPWSHRNEEEQKNSAEREVETLKKKMETHQKELDTKIKEVEHKQAEVQQLRDEVQRMETTLRTLTEDLESNNKEVLH